jgi:hypothetical protein
VNPAHPTESQGNALLRQHNYAEAADTYMRTAVLAVMQARNLESAQKVVERLTLKIARALERGARSKSDKARALDWYEGAVTAFPGNRQAYRMYSNLRRRMYQKPTRG